MSISLSCPCCAAEMAPWDSVTAGSESFGLWNCPACGFIRVFPPPGAEAFARSYDRDFASSGQQAFRAPAIRRNAKARVGMLRGHLENGRVLDVGCGTGVFVDEASAFFDAAGIDGNGDALAEGVEKGLDLRKALLEPSLFPPETFDAMTFWDVIASIPEPVTVFASATKFLKPGGLMIATYPSVDSLFFKITRKRWPFMIPPVNVSFHTRRSLLQLAGEYGFEEIGFSRPFKRVDVRFLLYKLKNMLGLRPDRPRHPSSIQLPVNTFDIHQTILRKREACR